MPVCIIQANRKGINGFHPLYYFLKGDSTVCEQPLLTVIKSVWSREPNRFAKILSNLSGSVQPGQVKQFSLPNNKL